MQEEISFGAWLHKQRRALDLTRQAFAHQVGCAEVTLRRIEAGTLKPSQELASLLLKKLGIPEVELPQWISFARGLSDLPMQSIPSKNKPITNLPAALTSYIGREKELAEVAGLISKYRLVTITGSGGVGKTRLSMKVAEQLLRNYVDGVWLIELASLSDPILLPQTVAALLGITPQYDTSYTDLIINFLRPKGALLILDNCEHLVDGCAHFADTLLKNCPHLKLLTTSREPIGATGEAVYRVPSLAFPGPQQLRTLDRLKDYESVRLFEERAQLVQFDFSLTPENASAVAQICQRLDGIPLAIELAAAKVGMFSIEQIGKQLDESFNILTGGSRTALPRHQTLRASMNWSWDLLSEEEQTLIQQLSVFAGGWTLEAAQMVCEGDVLQLTDALVKKSLIVMNREENRDPRYGFHEIVRQYAHEKFVEVGEEEGIRTRHLKYFLQLSKQAEPELKGSSQMQWYARLKDERDNLRSALGWADRTDLEAGLYLSSRLGTFWWIFGLREGNDWLSRFLQKSESHTYPKARAKALYMHGLILGDLQQLDAAYSAAKECLELYRSLEDQEGEIDGLLLLNWDAWLSATERIELTQRALALAQSLGDVPRQMDALWQLGYLDPGNKKLMYWEKALELARSSGNVRWLADYLSMMALELAYDGDLDSALKYLNESDTLDQQFDLNPPPRDLLSAHGQIALLRGDYERARTHFQESAEMHVEFANRHEYLYARARLGYVALREANLATARHLFSETAREFQKDKHAIGVVFTLEGMTGVYVGVDKPDYAARLVGWADATRERVGEWRPILEQENIDKIIAACIAKLGEAAFSASYAEGKQMSLEEAMGYTLEED